MNNAKVLIDKSLQTPSSYVKNPAIVRLVRRKSAFVLVFFTLAFAIYFAFFFIVAYEPRVMMRVFSSFGAGSFMMMFVMFFLAWFISSVYVRLSERWLDPLEREAVLSIAGPGSMEGDGQ